MGLVTLIFDRLTLKLVCESHLRWETFLLNLGPLGFLVLDYSLVRDGRTDGHKQRLLPLPYGGGA